MFCAKTNAIVLASTYTAGHVAQGTSATFHMIGHFVADHSPGHRIKTRPYMMSISRP